MPADCRRPFRERSAEPVEPLDPRPVAEMEARHPVERFVALLRLEQVARAEPQQRILERVGQSRLGAASRACATRRTAATSSGGSHLIPASATAASSQRAEAGHGRQRREVLLSRGCSLDEIEHHLLDQKVAEGDAAQTVLAVADRVEDGGVGALGLRARRPGPARGTRSSRPGRRAAPPRQRSTARRAAPGGRRRSSAGPAPAAGACPASRGSRAPPRARSASRAAPPACSSRSAAARGTRD